MAETSVQKRQLNISTLKSITSSYFEPVLILVGIILLGAIFFNGSGGPIFSDELWYMNVGLKNQTDPFILNRYTHVFAQKLFMEIASTPLIGSRIFWAILITTTAGMVYIGARFLSKRNNFFHGLIALGLFLSLPFLAEYSGTTIVDITTMNIMALFAILYIFSLRSGHSKNWLVILMGFVFFLGIKTKENALSLAILLPAFGLMNERFTFSRLWDRLKYFIIGLIAGVLFFILINGLVLKDPFFGIKPADWKYFFQTYVGSGIASGGSPEFYTNYIFIVIPVPFLLYVISGVKSKDRFSISERLLWPIPLLVLLFLIYIMARYQWGLIPRYFFPAFPFVAMLAPQFLDFQLPDNWKSLSVTFLLLAIGFVFLVGLRSFLIFLSDRLNWTFADFLTNIFYPVILTVLMGIIFLVGKYNKVTVVIPVLILFALLFYPLSHQFKQFILVHPNQARVEERFYPFSAFSQQIKPSTNMIMCVAPAMTMNRNMLSDKVDELLSMVNVYYDTQTSRGNYRYFSSSPEIPSQLAQYNCDYALMKTDEWMIATENAGENQSILQNYQVNVDPKNILVLLSRK
jgi:hypothetical protein